MTRSRSSLPLAITIPGLALFLAPAFSQDPPPTPEIPVVASVETEKLVALEGQTVRVTGFVERTGESQAGNQFLNFAGSDFMTVTFSSDVSKFTDGAPAGTYKDKTVAVTGPLKIYKGIPEIVLNDPSLIEIIDPADAAVPEEKPEPESPPEPEAPEPEPEPEPEAAAPETEPVDTSRPGLVDWRKYFPE